MSGPAAFAISTCSTPSAPTVAVYALDESAPNGRAVSTTCPFSVMRAARLAVVHGSENPRSTRCSPGVSPPNE
ncbi:hypothetical protein ABID70_001470 [Clavibacter michiganensis]